jgi:integration host factor subunit beta
MTKSELIELLAERRDIRISQAEQIVGTIFESMAEALASEGRIEIRGFGSFNAREYPGHTGRNPKTGVVVTVKPRRLPRFKVGKDLSERIMGQMP